MSDTAPQSDSPAAQHKSPKKASKAKRTTKLARWQQMVEQSSDAVFVLDARKRILFVNSSFTNLTGFTLEDISGRTCRQYSSAAGGSMESLLSILNPPGEILTDRYSQVSRPALTGPARIWEISFLPLNQNLEGAVIIGKIEPAGDHAVDRGPLPAKLLALRDRSRHWHRLDQLQSESPAMQCVCEQVRWASQCIAPILIAGERGAGKEYVARIIHTEGLTRDRFFAGVDCRRPPAAVLQEMLFAQEGLLRNPALGTLYLKEPQHLSKDLQAKITDWLQQQREQPAPSNQPRLLAGLSVLGNPEETAPQLQDALRCAFGVMIVHLPPLRERRAEIRHLTERMLERIVEGADREITGITPDAWELFESAPWPGNLAELFSVLRQACRRAAQPQLQATDFPWYLRQSPVPEPPLLPLEELLKKVERRLIELALQRAGQNKTKAAEILSIWRARLIRRVKELGIEEQEEQS